MSDGIQNTYAWCVLRTIWVTLNMLVIGLVQGDTKNRELLKNPTKIEEIQEKKLLTEIEPL